MKDAVAILSVFAEPTRLAALRLLRDGGEHCVCELMEALVRASRVHVAHISALRDAGLVADRRDAQWVRYRLNPTLPAKVRHLLDAALDLAETAEKASRMNTSTQLSVRTSSLTWFAGVGAAAALWVTLYHQLLHRLAIGRVGPAA